MGLACMAFRDRFLAEPANSQRRKDYEDGLKLFRELTTEYLEGWCDWGAGKNEPAAYYYEGPHYLRYWSEYMMGTLLAHERLFPETAVKWPALTLQPSSPLARMLRAHAMLVAPTHQENQRVRWGPMPLDDSWLYPDVAGVPLILAAFWIAKPDRPADAIFADLARRTGTNFHRLLLAQEELANTTSALALPRAAACKRAGFAVLRTGSGDEDLTVALKNTPTSMDGKAPTLWSHAHQDNGQVVAYRNGEPILIDPGYGPGGYNNKKNKPCPFSSWNHHNVLLVEDTEGYPPEVREVVGESGRFILPVWPDAAAGPAERITRCEEVKDALGPMLVMETELPTHRRLVIVPDAAHLLVVDRLKAPKRIKLCWWGNGSVGGRENGGAKENKPWLGDPDKRQTAAIDPAKAEGVFYRGPTLAARIRVVWPEATVTTAVEGEYGPYWYQTNYPLSGLHVESKEPVKFAVTLVDIAPMANGNAPPFPRKVQAMTATDGNLQTIQVNDTKTNVIYAFGKDNTFFRKQK
mgnify:CR=1 FL=1